MKFNERLRQICREKNIDQSRLAIMVGITQSAVSKYLNSQLPNFEIGLKIASVLMISPYALLNDSNNVAEESEVYGDLDIIKKKIISMPKQDQLDLLNWLSGLNSD